MAIFVFGLFCSVLAGNQAPPDRWIIQEVGRFRRRSHIAHKAPEWSQTFGEALMFGEALRFGEAPI